MEVFDNEAAKRVWQRVQGRQDMPNPEPELPALIREEWEDGAVCLYLSRRFQGSDGALLRRLSEENRAHAACLKGICILITGEKPPLTALPPSQEPAQILFRRCCGRALRRIGEYERRSAHPEYGPIFQLLAQQKKAQCQKLLQLLGSMEK